MVICPYLTPYYGLSPWRVGISGPTQDQLGQSCTACCSMQKLTCDNNHSYVFSLSIVSGTIDEKNLYAQGGNQSPSDIYIFPALYTLNRIRYKLRRVFTRAWASRTTRQSRLARLATLTYTPQLGIAVQLNSLACFIVYLDILEDEIQLIRIFLFTELLLRGIRRSSRGIPNARESRVISLRY